MAGKKALSRILTEIVLMMVGVSAAVGAYSLYNGYIQDSSQVCRLACTDIVAVAGAGQVYVTVKNIGTADTDAAVYEILEVGTGITLAINCIDFLRLEPGRERTLVARVDGLKAGVKYSVTVVGRSGQTIATYVVVETVAAP